MATAIRFIRTIRKRIP
ncbi:hypothetical protein KIPB_009183, partial [Kipferlia bialata]|eukprot:g9183.t1